MKVAGLRDGFLGLLCEAARKMPDVLLVLSAMTILLFIVAIAATWGMSD